MLSGAVSAAAGGLEHCRWPGICCRSLLQSGHGGCAALALLEAAPVPLMLALGVAVSLAGCSASPRRRAFSERGFTIVTVRALLALALGSALFGSTAPPPLYGIRPSRWPFSSTTLTALFSVHAVGMLGVADDDGSCIEPPGGASRRDRAGAGRGVVGSAGICVGIEPGRLVHRTAAHRAWQRCAERRVHGSTGVR